MNKKVIFPPNPYTPDTAKCMIGVNTLKSMRDMMTHSKIDDNIKNEIESIFSQWKKNPESVLPFSAMRNVLEDARKKPSSDERIIIMNSIVKTLGKPHNLAIYLDMLRKVSNNKRSNEQKLCQDVLQSDKMHSIYGWCGNTTIVESFDYPTTGTHKPIEGLEEVLGTSTSAWKLIIHIWQPNKNAKGFIFNEQAKYDSILEPPHSHPFDFVSTIVKGQLCQSIYSQEIDNVQKKIDEKEKGHYTHIELEHVDGVWPPHNYREKCYLTTKEHRVILKEGDSYYMPCGWIHDVEVEAEISKTKPTISLFLSSEFMVMPHVYMSDSMVEFHEKNPNIKKFGKSIPESSWHKKLELISNYLRGESESLNLNNVVNYEGEYAFQHRI